MSQQESGPVSSPPPCRSAQPDVKSFFKEWVAAAKILDWRPNENPGIHHSYASRGVSDETWEEEKQETLRLVFPHDLVFHLQIRLEQRGNTGRHRFIVFGRRVKALDSATPNTQRATFNSDHADDTGYWLRPNFKPEQADQLARRLPGPQFPRWTGKYIQLGADSPYVCLRRFLIALAAIEEVKGKWDPAPLPFAPEDQEPKSEFEASDLDALITIQEGRHSTMNAGRRSRCQRLLGEAREHFRSLDPKGRLTCRVCGWSPLVPTRSEIVQVHHLRQLSAYPKSGLRLTLTDAIANLAPLCPNCHRMLESHPNGGCYALDELTNLIARKTS